VKSHKRIEIVEPATVCRLEGAIGQTNVSEKQMLQPFQLVCVPHCLVKKQCVCSGYAMPHAPCCAPLPDRSALHPDEAYSKHCVLTGEMGVRAISTGISFALHDPSIMWL
jgi:hypothetical protein